MAKRSPTMEFESTWTKILKFLWTVASHSAVELYTKFSRTKNKEEFNKAEKTRKIYRLKA